MAKNFRDDRYEIMEQDIDKIRTRPSMYIGHVDEVGALHLCKELINNNIDECLKPESPADTVTIDISNKRLLSKDNGRGIPIDLLRVVHETNQAGSNFTRETGTATAGENGTGTTCLTALSKDFMVTTYRPSEKTKLTLTYHEGKLMNEQKESYNGPDHGLESCFTPSKKILGTDQIPCELLIDWLNDFQYTLPAKINLSYKYNGNTTVIRHLPLHQYITDRIGDHRLCEPLYIECEGPVDEVYREQTYHQHFKLSAVVAYSSKEYKGDPIRQAWMNMIHNPDCGSHVNGVINGLSKFLTERVLKKKPSLKDDDLKKDILANLQVVVNAECNMINMFTSQAKHHVFPKELTKAITNAVYEALCNLSPSRTSDLVDVVIANNRVRKEGERVRDIKSETKQTKWEKPDSYTPFSSAKTDEPKELFLVEGNSAGGGLREARFPKFQAILRFRGKSLNVWKASEGLSRVMKSEVWLNLIKILGCGIGDTFDIRKLAFDKIIIATDADIDGYHIRVQICAFFLLYYPEIIHAGKLYIAEPPLYELGRGKQRYYVASQGEYIAKCIESVGKMKTTFPQSKDYKNTRSADFFVEAFDYLTRLKECAAVRSVNVFLLEYIANGFARYGSVEGFIDHMDAWLKLTTKVFHELGFDHDNNQIYATIDLRDQLVILDDDLMHDLEDIINIQKKYGLIVEYESVSRTGVSTIGHFFEVVEAVYPKILDRYKGLGSAPGIVSREVIMDPKTRRIFRVTAQDADVMIRMANLVGGTKENIDNRKELLMNFKFTQDMLDN